MTDRRDQSDCSKWNNFGAMSTIFGETFVSLEIWGFLMAEPNREDNRRIERILMLPKNLTPKSLAQWVISARKDPNLTKSTITIIQNGI